MRRGLKKQPGREGVTMVVRCGNVEQIPPAMGPGLCADWATAVENVENAEQKPAIQRWWQQHAEALRDCAKPDEARTFVQQRRARHEPTQRIIDLLLRGDLTPKHPEEWARLMARFRRRG